MYCIQFQNIRTFTYEKTLLHTLFLLVFKIVQRLQCILNFDHLLEQWLTGGKRDEKEKKFFEYLENDKSFYMK